jgi:catechol 2,3-dioxygenase-like lactoylglutathione lyase family enzyme
MPATANHHVALRVEDINRGIQFYVDAFDAEVLTLPFPIEGEFAEVVAEGPAGVHWRTAILAVGDGGVELFEFEEPKKPIDPTHMTEGNLLHFCIQVDDVAAALARVEEAGGRRLWPEVVDLDDQTQVIYVADPDQNVIEVINADARTVAKLMVQAHPDSDPGAATA